MYLQNANFVNFSLAFEIVRIPRYILALGGIVNILFKFNGLVVWSIKKVLGFIRIRHS